MGEVCQVQLSLQAIDLTTPAAGDHVHGSVGCAGFSCCSLPCGLPLWSACLKVVFVIRKANTPRCGPLHCVHSISSEGVLKLQSVMALMLLVMTESLRPWDGALRGRYYLACQEGGGSLCFPSILGVMTTV